MFGSKNKELEQQMEMRNEELQQGRQMGGLEYDSKTSQGDMDFMQSRDSDLTRWQQDLDDDLNDIIHRLKRQVKTKSGWKPIPGKLTGRKDVNGNPTYKPLRPMMNDFGISFFVASVQGSLSRNLMMSNLDQDMIFTKLRGTVGDFIHHLGYHRKEYEIDEGDLTAILRIFRNLIEPAHFRALNNGERNYLNTINRRLDHFTHDQQPQAKKGFLGGMLG